MSRRFNTLVSGLALGALVVASASTATAQEPAPQPQLPPAQTPAATAPDAGKPVLLLNGEVALITLVIKPDKTADFEYVLTKLKESLEKSENPQRKEQAAGWRVFKAPNANGNAVYVMRIDPVVKGAEYDISRIIAEVFPVEVQEVFAKYKDAFAGRAITELTPFMSMSGSQ